MNQADNYTLIFGVVPICSEDCSWVSTSKRMVGFRFFVGSFGEKSSKFFWNRKKKRASEKKSNGNWWNSEQTNADFVYLSVLSEFSGGGRVKSIENALLRLLLPLWKTLEWVEFTFQTRLVFWRRERLEINIMLKVLSAVIAFGHGK